MATPSVPVLRISQEKHRETIVAYLFLLPAILGFLIFVAGPLITSIGLSFVQWDMFSPAKFVGFQNFTTMLKDVRLRAVYINTLLFILGSVSVNIVLALLLAYTFNREISKALKYFYRTTFFFPVITSAASVSIIWSFFLNTDFGPVNYYLSFLGIPKIPWLGSSKFALLSTVMVDVWKRVGFNMFILVAGLQGIPRQYYEAASVDGASAFQRFFKITLPFLSPTLFFAIVISLIDAFQVFDLPFVLTGGGPGDATRSVVYYIYDNGFRFFRRGYASAVSLTLFMAIMLLTLLQMKLKERWVFNG